MKSQQNLKAVAKFKERWSHGIIVELNKKSVFGAAGAINWTFTSANLWVNRFNEWMNSNCPYHTLWLNQQGLGNSPRKTDIHIYYILYIYVYTVYVYICTCIYIYIYTCIYLHIHTWHHMTWHDIIWLEMICIGLILLVYISHPFSWGISACWRNTDLLLMESLPIVGANSRSNIEIGWNRYGINWRLTSKHADVLFWNKL